MQKLDVEDTIFPRKSSISAGGKLLDLSEPKVMGILNITPDSFYAGSRMASLDQILRKAEEMIKDGAAIIDIGGYSSRPGADDVTVVEEIERIVPAIRAITAAFDCFVSIDTFRSSVAEEAISVGASIINDISGFAYDEKLPLLAGKHNIPYVLMHMRGTPKTMQSQTSYDNLFTEMAQYFSEKIAVLKEAGVNDIVLDPGFGFSKTLEDNHLLLKNLDYFNFLGCPILAGLSRKSMIYNKLESTSKDALPGTIALNTLALDRGASILRVHDVKEAADLIRLLK